LVSMGAFRYAIRKHGTGPAQPALDARGAVASNGVSTRNEAKLTQLIPVVQDVRLRNILHRIGSYPPRKMQDLALECNLSVSRLQHLFKQRTGFGLGQLLAEQRMLQATDFLVNSTMSIKEIAGTLGYEHASSFTRAFERRYRQSPSCYRQSQSPCEMSAKITPPRENLPTLALRSPQKRTI
jgi:AraC-like DNA-binding protein